MARIKSEAQKSKAVDKLAYEIKMLSRTALVLCRKRQRKLSWVYRNSTIHSFLLAVRNLHEFFFLKAKNGGQITADQLVAGWACSAPEFIVGEHSKGHVRETRRAEIGFDVLVSQRLAHLTWSRVNDKKIDWTESAIIKEFLRPIEKFVAELPPHLRTPYFDRAVVLLRRTCDDV